MKKICISDVAGQLAERIINEYENLFAYNSFEEITIEDAEGKHKLVIKIDEEYPHYHDEGLLGNLLEQFNKWVEMN